MATVVLGIAATGVLLPFTSGAAVRAEGMGRTLGVKLAGDLMEEIVNTPFDQIMATYDGYFEPLGQVKDANGVVLTGSNYANFGRDSSCCYAYVPQESTAAMPKYIFIRVHAYYKNYPIVALTRLVSN